MATLLSRHLRPLTNTKKDDQALDAAGAVSSAVETTTEWIAPVEQVDADDTATTDAIDADELKLPDLKSLSIVLMSNVLMQLTFFIIVSSSNEYAQHLGGTSTFSGLVIGIPTAVSMMTLYPLSRVDKGVYKIPLNFACGTLVLGNVLYALAYRANFLYLILIGRMVCGLGFTFWMYAKRYCSDPRIVGIRRRTTLAGWQVLGQGMGFSLGPFAGGLLSRMSMNNAVFNGFTSPGWLMAAMWAVFWVCVRKWFTDAPEATPARTSIPMQTIEDDAGAAGGSSTPRDVERTSGAATPTISAPATSSRGGGSLVSLLPHHRLPMSGAQIGVTATMMWFAMCCFFILGAWESNIPVFTASTSDFNPFHFSPFASGNMIALGGACAFPFLLANLYYSRRTQDRNTLALGTAIGTAGLLISMSILASHKVNYGSFFVAWWLVAIGFNIASTVTLSLLSKQLPGEWNGKVSVLIQCSNYTGRVTGAVWGGAGVKVGMLGYVGLQMGYVAIGSAMFLTLWKSLKAKTG